MTAHLIPLLDAGPFDPVGARLWRREWVVYRYEIDGVRLAMHRRRLMPSASVGVVSRVAP